jgi:membrane complex biogenesis BtpA family protein
LLIGFQSRNRFRGVLNTANRTPVKTAIFPFIGVIHLKPLPGSPRWDGSMSAVVRAAVADAVAYEKGGANAVIVENFGDLPFTKTRVPAETVAAMAIAGKAVREAVRLPIGFNVLRNDPLSGLALCAACDGCFIRVNVHCGSMLTDQGMIEGDAFNTVRRRRELGLEQVAILADVQVKHAVPLGEQSLSEAARDTFRRGLADALIVSGFGTGLPTDVEDVSTVREACPEATVLLGSGVTADNAGNYLPFADGFIVGSSLKRGGHLAAPVDARRVAALTRAIRGASRQQRRN